jgi:3-deoxy-D-manno-octulosonic-acid transferase
MPIVYTIIIHLIYFLLLPSAWFSTKARLWINGRKNWRHKLHKWQRPQKSVYWFHAASLGEFEQGLPVIDALKESDPGCSIIISFFSPSGYEVRKDYKNADLVFYLPLDTRYNAKALISILNPDADFFIKYEFWYFILDELKKKGKPVYLLSGIFRPRQVFFRWYGYWFRKNLLAFEHLFVQNEISSTLLNSIGIKNTSITGDTRFDRVAANARKAKDLPTIADFISGSDCIVAGSTWPEDEALLTAYINNASGDLKFIIAPHEINKGHIDRLIKTIRKSLVLYSHASQKSVREMQVLIIDNIGMLSSIYRYGKIAYIGGGFGKGIHNVLEAAVYGSPVIFGPNYQKHREAIELITAGGGFSVENENGLYLILNKLRTVQDFYANSADRAGNFVMNNTGSTGKIMQHLKNKFKLN